MEIVRGRARRCSSGCTSSDLPGTPGTPDLVFPPLSKVRPTAPPCLAAGTASVRRPAATSATASASVSPVSRAALGGPSSGVSFPRRRFLHAGPARCRPPGVAAKSARPRAAQPPRTYPVLPGAFVGPPTSERYARPKRYSCWPRALQDDDQTAGSAGRRSPFGPSVRVKFVRIAGQAALGRLAPSQCGHRLAGCRAPAPNGGRRGSALLSHHPARAHRERPRPSDQRDGVMPGNVRFPALHCTIHAWRSSEPDQKPTEFSRE